ncbi:MAG: DUF523 domain-containing protein [Deltaproteobacteria bacterium]|nr:DUF523 domain-containing protein [Deltaproteobacteria bacterium]
MRIGISRCLLGEAVRYNGGHKRARQILDAAGPEVCWVPVCPEVECGLDVPREPMHLEGNPDSPRLVTVKTRIDLTDRMESWIASRLAELEKEHLFAFIFKSRSPSCGICDVPVYDASTGEILSLGFGFFAHAFSARFGDIPTADENNAEKELDFLMCGL